jgi:elongation factor 1-alpha
MEPNIDKKADTSVAIAIAGSVDSGKSSTLGVLMSGKLDDGNGLARRDVAKHPHEIETGKTSAVSTRILKSSDKNSAITLIDLCGHEKYLKTTTYGLTGHFPDYALVIVAANRGILPMTKEHLRILFHLNVPFLFVITRVDITPEGIYKETLKTIENGLKKWNKKPKFINTMKEMASSAEELKIKEAEGLAELMMCEEDLTTGFNTVPVITISNKTGYYINPLREFLSILKPRKLWDSEGMDGTIFYIDSVFNPIGIGIVLSGIVKGQSIKIGDILHLGPKGKEFIQVRVKSIHNGTREMVSELKDHQRGCIAVATVDKKFELVKRTIEKGMIAMSEKYTHKICYRIKAEVHILNHSATISTNYSPVLHIGPIRQTAKLIIDKEENGGKDSLSTGDKAKVIFKFKFKPEFIEDGTTLFFREGTTRGVGKVVGIVELVDDPDPNPEPSKSKKFRRRQRPNNK